MLFDSDGTLIGERYPTYSDQCMLVQRLLHDETAGEGVPEDVAFAEELEAAILNHEPLPSSPRSTAQMAAESFAGFTVEEYQAYVREFLKQDVPGFEGMTYGSRFFVPMVELVRYLAGHDFQVYLCSGTERDYGDMAEAEEFAAECAALGFETVSMRDEFETIYAEGIEKAEDAALQPAA